MTDIRRMSSKDLETAIAYRARQVQEWETILDEEDEEDEDDLKGFPGMARVMIDDHLKAWRKLLDEQRRRMGIFIAP